MTRLYPDMSLHAWELRLQKEMGTSAPQKLKINYTKQVQMHSLDHHAPAEDDC